jgi:hypothetical protein
MLIPERKFAPKLEVIWIEHHMTWFVLMMLPCHYIYLRIIHACHKSSCHPWCIHEILWVHIHAIGVPRIVLQEKFRWAWNPKLKSVWGPEVQSDEAGEDVGTILKANPWSIFFRLRQAPEHYKPPTFKAIIYLYMLYVLLHYVIGIDWKPLLHW